ncbi:hypothetical protein ILYODFUR_036849 [Ilyodon furcidens]|uniref:Uncharacterized protein n=1 Tax=Ilyodon furcidens TaxID=33524 RepID=A0ABV0VKV8_9TELE
MQTRAWMRLFKNSLQLYLKKFHKRKGKNENTAGTNMSNPKTYMCTPCRNEANIKQSPGLASGQNRVKMNNNKEPAGNKEHRPIHIQQDVRGEQRTDNQKTQNRYCKETGRPKGQVEQIDQ